MSYLLLNSDDPGTLSAAVAASMSKVSTHDVSRPIRGIRVESGTTDGSVIVGIKKPGTEGLQLVPRTSGGENPFLAVALPAGRVEFWAKNTNAAAVAVIVEILTS